ncbi:MAG: M16 family metallopeptidase [Bacilli bacterium]
MDYKIYKYTPFNIHCIKTDKFKAKNLQLIFRSETNKMDYLTTNFLLNVLFKGSKEYPNKKLLALKSEELYNSTVSFSNSRLGYDKIVKFNLNFLDNSFTEEENEINCIKYLKSIIFNPNIKNNRFDEKIISEVRNIFQEELDASKDNKQTYAYELLFESLDKDSPFNFVHYKEKDLNLITNKMLIKAYNDLINKSIVDIFIVGNLDNKYHEFLNKQFSNIKTLKKDKDKREYTCKKIRKNIKKKTIIDKDTKQTQFIMSFNTVNLTTREKLYVMPLFISCFGGLPSSLLFTEIREKLSLCYIIRSYYSSFDNKMFIYAGISNENIDKTYKAIAKILKAFKNNSNIDNILKKAKKSIENSIISSFDYPKSIIRDYYMNHVYNESEYIYKYEFYESVSKDEINYLIDKIIPEMMFCLTKGEDYEK